MTLGQFTSPKLLVPRLLSRSRRSAIIELSKRLERAGRIENPDSFVEATLDHDSIACAVIDGVAFLLAHGLAVKELCFAVGLSTEGIVWSVRQSRVVRTVVLFTVPMSETRTYLLLVAAFAAFVKDGLVFSAFTAATQPEEMFTALTAVRLVRLTERPESAEAGVKS